MGPLSLTGQPNAMGGREVGGLANMLAAHMAIENPVHWERVRGFWKSPGIAERPGLKAVDMFEAVADGRIKAIWIMSTNPVVSMPDADAVKAALETCPFVVVSDIQKHTDTARLAHVLLPASGWGEKSGTVTNSERRISRQRPFLSVPGEARADWWQLAEVGKRLGFGADFDYRGPADIYAEHAALSAFENDGQRDFDIGAHAGIDAETYEALLPFQWPLRQNGSSIARFFADGGFFTSDRKARLVPIAAPALEEADGRYPFTLNTGRIRDHWHTMTRTGKSARLSAHIAEPFCEIHPADAASAGISDADLVCVEGANGRSILARALLTERQMRGAIFVPMHWTGETAPSARVDTLVSSRVDPTSGQPALKMSRASVTRHVAKAHGFLVSASRPLDLPFTYWSIAKAEGGYRVEFAGEQPAEGWETWLRSSLQLEDNHEYSGYIDERAGDHRLLVFEGERLQAALFVSAAPVSVSRQWAVDQLKESHQDRNARSMLVAGRPAAGRPDNGAIVCSCFSVGINQINIAARAGCRSIEAIGVALSAGTNCGSCRPEIRRILDATQPIAAE
jgi:assimilatory nitrate reductase catalytic subunit